MITVDYGYKLVNGKEFNNNQTDIDTFRRFCQTHLRGMRRDGTAPRYYGDDISALYCRFSDGRQFIWQRHYVTKYGRHIGGWQPLKTLPFEAAKEIVHVS